MSCFPYTFFLEKEKAMVISECGTFSMTESNGFCYTSKTFVNGVYQYIFL